MDGFDGRGTADTLRAACQQVNLDFADATLIRLGENAIYHLPSANVVARIARTLEYLSDVEKEVAVARWLEHHDLPAASIAEAYPQPLIERSRVVTFWNYIAAGSPDATVTDLALLLRRLHALPVAPDLPLGRLDPFSRVEGRISGTEGISREDRTVLRERFEELRGRYGDLRFELGTCVIHGDANIGNVMRRADGQVLLLDLDNFAVGPPEWDLTLTATYYQRFSWHSKEEYDRFAVAYGFDVMEWPGFEVLRDIRELHMVTWLMQNVGHDPAAAAEFSKRISQVRARVAPHDWKPF